MKSNPIYMVYVVCLDKEGSDYVYRTNAKGHPYCLGSRTWGWWPSFEQAEEVILKNQGDIFEYSYNFACVEEVPWGMSTAKVKQWYQAIFDPEKMKDGPYPEVIKCSAPPFANNVFNFSIG